MKLPSSAIYILQQLNNAGFEAFVVGGCVRDFLRGITPDDIDITTNALPEQILDVFHNDRTIPTGLQHGTITVLLNDEPFEITTYRTDGTYSDGRHPDSVAFTTSLEADLARRDFTVNAMAYHPKQGLIDPFGGKQDLERGVLRCVGDPMTRFTEDALRIARLVRFMSVLSFKCDDNTAQAAHNLVTRLDLVAAERKRVELMKLIMGDGFLEAATIFSDVLCQMVPALSPLCGFEQHNPHHSFDVYTHTVRAVHFAAKDPIVRLAVLLHDTGKPATFFKDQNGIGHFYGHPVESEKAAVDTLKRLRFDNITSQIVTTLVRWHDKPVTEHRRQIKRYMSKIGVDTLRRLICVKEADARGCHIDSKAPDYHPIQILIEDILQNNECFTMSSLAVNGNDLIDDGFEAGPMIGAVLRTLLKAVIDDRCENNREALLAYAKGCDGRV